LGHFFQKNGNFLNKKVVECGEKWEKYVLLNCKNFSKKT
jgi:hypothetical protein